MYHLGVGASPGFGGDGDDIYHSVRLIDFDSDSLIFLITNIFFNFLFTFFFFLSFCHPGSIPSQLL